MDDTPSVRLVSPDSAAWIGGRVSLRGSVAEAGRIAAYEWDIGGTGEYRRASGPDTSFRMPDLPQAGGRLLCRLRVRDDDGRVGTADVEIRRIPWRALAPLPRKLQRMAAVAHVGSIFVTGGYATDSLEGSRAQFRYDTASKADSMAAGNLRIRRPYIIRHSTRSPIPWSDRRRPGAPGSRRKRERSLPRYFKALWITA